MTDVEESLPSIPSFLAKIKYKSYAKAQHRMHLKVSNPTRLQKQLEIERQNFGLKSTEAIWKWPKQIQVNFFGPFLRLDKKKKKSKK